MGSRECHDNNRYIAEIASQDALGGPLEAAAVNGIDDFELAGKENENRRNVAFQAYLYGDVGKYFDLYRRQLAGVERLARRGRQSRI